MNDKITSLTREVEELNGDKKALTRSLKEVIAENDTLIGEREALSSTLAMIKKQQTKKWVTIKQPGDGVCLFHSIFNSLKLQNVNNLPWKDGFELRAWYLDRVLSMDGDTVINSQTEMKLCDIFQESIKSWYDKMLPTKLWGGGFSYHWAGEDDCDVLAYLLNINLIEHTDNGEEQRHTSENATVEVHVAHSVNHYDLLISHEQAGAIIAKINNTKGDEESIKREYEQYQKKLEDKCDIQHKLLREKTDALHDYLEIEKQYIELQDICTKLQSERDALAQQVTLAIEDKGEAQESLRKVKIEYEEYKEKFNATSNSHGETSLNFKNLVIKPPTVGDFAKFKFAYENESVDTWHETYHSLQENLRSAIRMATPSSKHGQHAIAKVFQKVQEEIEKWQKISPEDRTNCTPLEDPSFTAAEEIIMEAFRPLATELLTDEHAERLAATHTTVRSNVPLASVLFFLSQYGYSGSLEERLQMATTKSALVISCGWNACMEIQNWVDKLDRLKSTNIPLPTAQQLFLVFTKAIKDHKDGLHVKKQLKIEAYQERNQLNDENPSLDISDEKKAAESMQRLRGFVSYVKGQFNAEYPEKDRPAKIKAVSMNVDLHHPPTNGKGKGKGKGQQEILVNFPRGARLQGQVHSFCELRKFGYVVLNEAALKVAEQFYKTSPFSPSERNWAWVDVKDICNNHRLVEGEVVTFELAQDDRSNKDLQRTNRDGQVHTVPARMRAVRVEVQTSRPDERPDSKSQFCTNCKKHGHQERVCPELGTMKITAYSMRATTDTSDPADWITQLVQDTQQPFINDSIPVSQHSHSGYVPNKTDQSTSCNTPAPVAANPEAKNIEGVTKDQDDVFQDACEDHDDTQHADADLEFMSSFWEAAIPPQ